MLGKDRLCAEVTNKRFGTVAIGEDQCKINIWKGNKYWCLTVTLENHWDQVNNKYEVEIRRGQFTGIELEIKNRS